MLWCVELEAKLMMQLALPQAISRRPRPAFGVMKTVESQREWLCAASAEDVSDFISAFDLTLDNCYRPQKCVGKRGFFGRAQFQPSRSEFPKCRITRHRWPSRPALPPGSRTGRTAAAHIRPITSAAPAGSLIKSGVSLRLSFAVSKSTSIAGPFRPARPRRRAAAAGP